MAYQGDNTMAKIHVLPLPSKSRCGRFTKGQVKIAGEGMVPREGKCVSEY